MPIQIEKLIHTLTHGSTEWGNLKEKRTVNHSKYFPLLHSQGISFSQNHRWPPAMPPGTSLHLIKELWTSYGTLYTSWNWNKQIKLIVIVVHIMKSINLQSLISRIKEKGRDESRKPRETQYNSFRGLEVALQWPPAYILQRLVMWLFL